MQRPWLDVVIKQAMEEYQEWLEKKPGREGEGADGGNDPNINDTREEPDRVRPEKHVRPKLEDAMTM